METNRDKINAKGREKELFQGLEKLSLRLKMGDDNSVEALYRLKDLLNKWEVVDLSETTNPRLLSIVWILKTFIHDLWANMGDDSKGFPKTGGMEILQNIAKHLGIFIQTSLFRNRPKDSMGTLEDIIKSYYDLLHLAEEANKKGIPPEEYRVL